MTVTTYGLVLHERHDIERAGVVGDDLGAARRLVRVADRDELLANHAHQHVALRQHALELLDCGLELLALLVELVAAELREAAERHVEDVVRLDLGELERLRHQRVAGRGAILRRADRLHDGVDHVERLHEALDDVQPRLRLLSRYCVRRVTTTTW